MASLLKVADRRGVSTASSGEREALPHPDILRRRPAGTRRTPGTMDSARPSGDLSTIARFHAIIVPSP
jgi:hypothetical protein